MTLSFEEIDAIAAQLIAENHDKALQALEKPTLGGWFLGRVMLRCGGKANPNTVWASLAARLNLDPEITFDDNAR